MDISALKRRLRALKKDELRIRPNAAELVWDRFFELRNQKKSGGAGGAFYSLNQLAKMNPQELQGVLDLYFLAVLNRGYQESGIVLGQAFDPALLARLGLSFDADEQAIKRRFRQLARDTHPDAGGDVEAFIELMRQYRLLLPKSGPDGYR